MKTLKNLVSISPLIGAFLIFLGMLKLTIYYSCFGVNIVQYIQISEVLISFLEDMNIILVMFIILIFHGFLSMSLFDTSSDIKFLRTYSKITRSRIMLWIPMVILLFCYYLFFKFHGIWWAYLTSVFLFNPLTYLTRKYFKKFSLENTLSQVLLFSLFTIAFTINLAINDVLTTRENNQKVEIELKSEVYNLESHERMIGKTNDYIFVSNIQDKSVRIILCSEVKSIKITKK